MPAIANITLADGQPTPVNRTFNPAKIDSANVAHFENRASGIPVGYDKLSIGLRQPAKTGGNYKCTVRLFTPTLEVTSASTGTGIQPAPTKAYDCAFFGEFVLPERSTTQNRGNLFALVQSLFANAGFKSVVEFLDNYY